MNRGLQIANLAGVTALAILCVFQWRMDRGLNHQLNAAEKRDQTQRRQLAENTRTIQGLTDDLAQFKADYADARTEAGELDQKARALELANERLIQERDRLHESVDEWAAAVAVRDQRLQEANTRLEELAGRLNESIAKFNSLATNYNSVVEALNQTRSAPAP